MLGLGVAGPGAAEDAVTACPAVAAGALPVTATDPTLTAGAVPVTTEPIPAASTTVPTPSPITNPAATPESACEEPAVGEPPAELVPTQTTATTIAEPAPIEPTDEPTDGATVGTTVGTVDAADADADADADAIADPSPGPDGLEPVLQQPSEPQTAPSVATDPTAGEAETGADPSSSTGTASASAPAEGRETAASAVTPGTAIGASVSSPDPDAVLDGQGTGDDVPVLEAVPSLPGVPTESLTLPGSPAFPTVPAPSSVAVAITGWTNPAIGRLTSAFGPRIHPVLGTAGTHAGQDIAARCGSPVYAAASGEVVWAGGALQGRTGNQVVIAHGDGVLTRYGHLLTGTVLVRQGDTVQAGQRIASVGGDRALDPFGAGNSTGCHLHFEVNLANGASPVDPLAFLAARGVRLGSDQPIVVVAPVDVAALVAAAPQATDAELTTWRKPLLPGFDILFEGRLPVVAVRAVG